MVSYHHSRSTQKPVEFTGKISTHGWIQKVATDFKRVLAIDQSYARFGYAVVDRDRIVQIGSYDYKRHQPEPKSKSAKRQRFRAIVTRLCDYYKPDAIVMEAVRPFPRNLNTITALAAMIYTIRDSRWGHRVPLYVLNSSNWKKTLLGNGRADKNDAIDFLLENYSDEQFDDDAADAGCMGLAFFLPGIKAKEID